MAQANVVKNAYVFNRSRNAFLASDLRRADTHWSRLRGLMATSANRFPFGSGLWIVPCHGVHTIAMRYPIDVVYLNDRNVVVHLEQNVQPWRVTPIRLDAMSVLEVRSPSIMSSGTCVGDQLEIADFVTEEK